MNKIIKKTWMALAVLIILAAVFSSIFRSLTPLAKQYKSEVEHHLSTLLGQEVQINSMETGWYWFEPVLKLQDITVKNHNKASLHLDQLIVGINLAKSLWYWRIQPGVLYLDDVSLVFRQQQGAWKIEGLSSSLKPENKLTPEMKQKLLSWVFQQERLIIKNVSAQFYFSDGTLIPVVNLNLSVLNQNGHYKLKGQAKLQQAKATSFKIIGDLYFDPFHLEYTKGSLYFSIKRLALAQWRNFLPKPVEQFEAGQGNVKLWLDLNKGSISAIQAKVNFKDLAWHLLHKNRELIQLFSANLAWNPDDKGWSLKADKIKLRLGDRSWPENQFMLHYDATEQSYKLFLKKILIESLLSQAIEWPPLIQKILKSKPHGTLTETQILVKNGSLEYLLTGFQALGWKNSKAISEVENLSGVLNWQPEEGRLELDSQNTSLKIQNYPEQKLDVFNSAIDWKKLSSGYKVSIDRFVVSNPQLTVTANGVLDGIGDKSLGNANFELDFSGKELQQWAVFLPKKYLKPKLYLWLTQDLKRIGSATGRIKVKGLMDDFPFDNNQGEFSIVSHITDGELLITSKWQLINELEAYLRLKSRDLDIDIIHGDIQGVPISQLNLRIDDIGKDKEILLIHTLIKGQAQKMINFVLSSPLKEKLATLKRLSLEGVLKLNLRIQAPLYPENNDNLVRGDVTLKDNGLKIKHPAGTLRVDDINGDLSFDEKGITHSALTATAFGFPLNASIQSFKTPQLETRLMIEGKCTVEALKKQFNLPIWSFLKGMFSLSAQLRITANPNDMDNMIFKTSLEGLAVNLPAPLGKTYDEQVPLSVLLDFNQQKGMRIRADYDGRISSDIVLDSKNSSFELKSGQILLGASHALHQDKPGLAINGTLDGFDLQKWKKVYEHLSTSQDTPSLLQWLRIIDVTLSKLTFLDQHFDNMRIQAKMLADKSWSFRLNQKDIDADLTYQSASNSLSGFIHYLHLSRLKSSDPVDQNSKRPNPQDIPNLNLRVDNLSVGDIQIGNITLKSQSKPQSWFIEYCRIDSPYYQTLISGEWLQNGAKNQTNIQMDLHFKDLAKSLQLWQVSPAVDAGTGDVEFNGHWKGSIYDFSLATLNGSMYLQLKNGRITHLSPETEEKLGLGKLLSILSLQTIPRRLKLDFSDLSHQGYSFDVFKGHFNITKGIMNTQDSYLDGPVAYAGMKGELDLVRRMYDLDLSIAPHITASLPIVATIAGGPIAGLAAWVANKIINQSMQKITGYTYKISGPWSEPVVQQLTIEKKLVKK